MGRPGCGWPPRAPPPRNVDLAAGLATARGEEYIALAAAAAEAAQLSPPGAAATLRRLRSQWRAINRRDFFPPPQREQARIALQELADRVEATSEVTP